MKAHEQQQKDQGIQVEYMWIQNYMHNLNKQTYKTDDQSARQGGLVAPQVTIDVKENGAPKNHCTLTLTKSGGPVG